MESSSPSARGFWIEPDPFQRRPYDDPKMEKPRNWFSYREYSGDFMNRVQMGDVENVAERSAISTLFAILGRTAIYNKKEVTWKGEFGDV